MKKLILGIVASILAVTTLLADVETKNYKVTKKLDSWDLYQFKIYFDNDLFGNATDSQYSSGEKFNLTYRVENPTNFLYDFLYTSDSKSDIFTTFAIANQIYTPVDTDSTELILDDRPYAGWTYIEMGMHKSSKKSLNSLQLKVGMVGPASKSEEIQNGIHNLINVSLSEGWEHQLNNELGINLGYAYKLRFAPEPIGWFESAFVPYVEADLGNISTQASLGIFIRAGYNIPKDFGLATLDIGGEAGIPVYDEQLICQEKDWSFSFNFTTSGSAVARDIFLDGNTFSDSHSIEKNNFVAYIGTGFSARYKSLSVDFMTTTNSKKAPKEGTPQDIGTVIATWIF